MDNCFQSSTKTSQASIQNENIIPKAIRHECLLPDGRKLSYYTFATEGTNQKELHPILYIHGFPGCGLEGAMCALEAEKKRCRVYCVDRPGFGHSDPLPSVEYNSPASTIDGFVRDTWDFIRLKKWKSFSIVGVSGGGVFALALIESYLNHKWKTQTIGKVHSSSLPSVNLEAVSIVGGVCCTTGVEGMMKNNKDVFYIASEPGLFTKSILRLSIIIPKIISWISPSMLISILTKDLPTVDKDAFVQNTFIKNAMIDVFTTSLRQGSYAASNEVLALFQKELHFEASLRNLTKNASILSKVPRISMFHGLKDKNVPFSHSWYVHEDLLNEISEIYSFPEYGHISLIIHKAEEYIAKASPVEDDIG